MNQFRADWVLAGTLKIGSGAPLVQMCSHPAQTTARGVGTGGQRGPQVLKSDLFSVAKCPSDIMKNVVQIAFLPQWPLIYDCIYFCILVCPEKFCYFRKKL
jgi:hypothetical protein